MKRNQWAFVFLWVFKEQFLILAIMQGGQPSLETLETPGNPWKVRPPLEKTLEAPGKYHDPWRNFKMSPFHAHL